MKINQLQIEIDDLILRGECPVDIRGMIAALQIQAPDNKTFFKFIPHENKSTTNRNRWYR